MKRDVVPVDKSYEVVPTDIEWACNGMVVKIRNGVSVAFIQQSISDVGFHVFMVAPFEGDILFLYFTGKMKVMSVFNKAADFFQFFCV